MGQEDESNCSDDDPVIELDEFGTAANEMLRNNNFVRRPSI
jgi:hypothetical protein